MTAWDSLLSVPKMTIGMNGSASAKSIKAAGRREETLKTWNFPPLDQTEKNTACNQQKNCTRPARNLFT
jgi:hypothetical protein